MDQLAPTVVQPLIEMSMGQLYALAPQFSVDVMVYNKDIFNTVGLAYPKEKQTWSEWVDISKRIPKDNGILAGIAMGNGGRFESLRFYAAQKDLQIFDYDSKEMAVYRQEWMEAWDQFVRWDAEGVFPKIGADYPSAPYAFDPLMGRRVAAAPMNLDQLAVLIDANEHPEQFPINNAYKPYEPVDWDMVSMPTHDQNSDRGAEITFEGLMGISVRSTQADLGWELIKSVNSVEWAQRNSQNMRWALARKDQMDRELWLNKNIDAFYELRPSFVIYDEIYEQTEIDFRYIELLSAADELMNESLAGRVNAEQALKSWNDRGNTILKLIK